MTDSPFMAPARDRPARRGEGEERTARRVGAREPGSSGDTEEELARKEKEAFRQRLRELRGKRKPTVVAECCGLNRNAVIGYENGDALPGFESLIKLADHFGVGVDYLMGR